MNATSTVLAEVTASANVRNKAMLATLNIRTWKAQKYDRQASHQVAENNRAKDKAGRYNKRLIDVDQYIKPIDSCGNRMREAHYSMTLPWLDNGQRILPMAHYQRYCGVMNDLRDEFDQAVRYFLSKYPDAKFEARQFLGSLYNDNEYPSVDQLAAKFEADYYMTPLPDSSDFRVDIDDADIEKAAERIDAALKQGEAEAWRRLTECVEAIASKLPAYDRGELRTFKDTLITNLRDIAELTPGLNILDNPRLEALASVANQRLAQYDAKTLKENEALRHDVAKEAEAILARMKVNQS